MGWILGIMSLFTSMKKQPYTSPSTFDFISRMTPRRRACGLTSASFLLLGAEGAFATRLANLQVVVGSHKLTRWKDLCGQAFIEEALSLPNPPKLTLHVLPRATLILPVDSRIGIVEGSLTDDDMLGKAMQGVDAVVNFLGCSSSSAEKSSVRSVNAVTIAMRLHGVRRILATSPASFLLPTEKRPLTWSTQLLLSYVFSPQRTVTQRAIATTLAAQSDLDWTIFRVPLLNDNDADLPVWAGLLTPDFRGTSYLSRGSLARWALGEVEEGRWVAQAPALGNWGDVDDRRIIRSTLVG